MKIFAPFRKVEAQDDGTIIVAGIASTEGVDADGEIIKASAIAAALPEFMRHGTGALREMHQLSAAGTVISAEVTGGETMIEAHVVDPVAVKKVQAGVYKGFSVGGKVMARDPALKKTITAVKLIEISLVDRPNNPDAVLTFWKVEGGEEPASPWQAERLADVSQQLGALQQDADWDAQDDGLKVAITALADVLGDILPKKAEDDAAADHTDDDLAAAAGTMDLAKIEGLIARALAPIAEQNAMLKAEIAAMKAEPAPAKAVLRVIGKAEDAGQPAIDDGFEPVRNPDGSINEPATEMKKVHAAGPVLAS
jgi:hypothetical protein